MYALTAKKRSAYKVISQSCTKLYSTHEGQGEKQRHFVVVGVSTFALMQRWLATTPKLTVKHISVCQEGCHQHDLHPCRVVISLPTLPATCIETGAKSALQTHVLLPELIDTIASCPTCFTSACRLLDSKDCTQHRFCRKCNLS